MTLDLNTILDILKVGVGLIYLYLEYNAKRSLWIASVIMPCIGMWLFFNKGLYADCAINAYYLVIAVYGWIVWSKQGPKSDKPERPISHVGIRRALMLTVVWLAVWGIIAYILATFTDSTVVALDSLTTSMSIIGMWMLARKYIEQWLIWFVVDAIYVYLYYYKGIYFSGSLYVFYTVMALLGYRKWQRMIRKEGSEVRAA